MVVGGEGLTKLSLATQPSSPHTYQKPEGPDVEGEAAEHLNNGCQQDHIFKVPVDRRKAAKDSRLALVLPPSILFKFKVVVSLGLCGPQRPSPGAAHLGWRWGTLTLPCPAPC